MSIQRVLLQALAFCLALLAGGPRHGLADDLRHPLCASAGEPATSGICRVIEIAPDTGKPTVLRGLVSPDTGRLPARLLAADFLLLGEVHDNGFHHQARSQLILALENQRLATGGKPPALILEHVRADQQMALAGFRSLDARRRLDVDTLFKALKWETSGWPDADLFRPMLAAALDAGWPMLAGNVTRDEIRQVARQGLAALPEDQRSDLGLETPLPEPLQASLLDELAASHCGLMPQTAFGGMADAQRFRDATMARVMAEARAVHGSAILLAGNGHVRRDRGVPWHLARMSPARTVVVVMYLEVGARRPKVDDYIERGADGQPLADYVVLTRSVARPDPCEEMRKRFRKK